MTTRRIRILAFAFPFLSIATKGISVFTEILPICKLEPTREQDVEFRERAQRLCVIGYIYPAVSIRMDMTSAGGLYI